MATATKQGLGQSKAGSQGHLWVSHVDLQVLQADDYHATPVCQLPCLFYYIDKEVLQKDGENILLTRDSTITSTTCFTWEADSTGLIFMCVEDKTQSHGKSGNFPYEPI